jgi:hypothetical protein
MTSTLVGVFAWEEHEKKNGDSGKEKKRKEVKQMEF